MFKKSFLIIPLISACLLVKPSEAAAPLLAAGIALRVVASNGAISSVSASQATASVGLFIKGFTIATAGATALTWLFGGYSGAPSQVSGSKINTAQDYSSSVGSLEVFIGYFGPPGCAGNSFSSRNIFTTVLPDSRFPDGQYTQNSGTSGACANSIGPNQTYTLHERYKFKASNGTFYYNQTNTATQYDGVSAGYNSSLTDKVIEWARSALSFQKNTDPDIPQSRGGETGFPVLTGDGSLTIASTNAVGQNVVTQAKPRQDGGTTLQENVQSQTNQISRTTVQVSPTGQIESVSTSQLSGNLAPVPTADGIAYSPIAASNQGQFDAFTGTVTFPSDYARVGEASSAAQEVVQGLLQGQINQPVVADVDMPWFGDTFDSVSQFQIGSSVAQCPVWSFNALGESFSFDHHCHLIQQFNVLFYAMFTAMWILVAFRTVMEA